MNNEEKLLKLLQIAVENGWKNHINLDQTFLNLSNILQLEMIVWTNYGDISYSINDLVCNWEKDKVSFIGALCKKIDHNNFSNSKKNDYQNYEYIFGKCQTFGRNIVETVRLSWNLKPTSERLNWLFDTFNHLL